MSLINRIPEAPLTRLSIKNKGKWIFILVPTTNAIYSDNNMRIFTAGVEFGLVASKQSNPAKISRYGSTSDLLIVRANGTLDTISNKEYIRRYKKSSEPWVTKPVTIKTARSRKKLEEQAQKLVPRPSNTVPAPRATKVERPTYNPQDERGSRY